MRKNTQALTASENPKANEMYSRLAVLGVGAMLPSLRAVLATCVAAKAKNRNMNVPTNSPISATMCFLKLSGRTERTLSRRFSRSSASVLGW